VHMINLFIMAPPAYTGPGARSPNVAMDSLTLDADAPGSVTRIGEYVRDTLARGYIVEASAAPTETATEPVA
jgi:hypothetical protein